MKIAETKIKYLLLLVFCIFLEIGTISSQELPMYSNYTFNRLAINPAYVGLNSDPEVSISYRNQWTNLGGAPVFGHVSYDQPVKDTRSSFSTMAYFDKLGIEKNIGLRGYYSFKAEFSENSFIQFGFSAGLRNYSHDYTLLHLYHKEDPAVQQPLNLVVPTAGVGLYYVYGNLNIGFSLPQLLKTTIDGAEYSTKYARFAENYFYGIVGYNLDNLPGKLYVHPSIVAKYVQGAPLYLDYIINFGFNERIGLGLSYRTNEAIVGMIDVKIGERMLLGYAYDFPLSDIGFYSVGSSEIMLKLRLAKKETPAEGSL